MIFVHEGVRALNEVGLEVVLKKKQKQEKWVKTSKRGEVLTGNCVVSVCVPSQRPGYSYLWSGPARVWRGGEGVVLGLGHSPRPWRRL